MDIKVLQSKADELLALTGIGKPKLTEEQKSIISEYVSQVADPLVDAFWDAKIPNQFSVVIEDLNEKVKFRLTFKKL